MNNGFDTANLIYSSILMLFFAIAMIRYGRSQIGQKLKFLLVWVIILLVVVAGYSYWPDIQRSKLYASLVPGAVITNQEGDLIVKKAQDGHFYINAEVNGKNIRFMVDTGASDITFSQKDVQKLEIDPNSLEYNKFYSTANGMTRGASIKISYLKVGSFEMNDFYASANEGQLENSLLGMDFLKRFKSFGFEGDSLILRP